MSIRHDGPRRQGAVAERYAASSTTFNRQNFVKNTVRCHHRNWTELVSASSNFRALYKCCIIIIIIIAIIIILNMFRTSSFEVRLGDASGPW